MHDSKLHPRLQTLSNGAEEVNGLRAQLSSLVVTSLSPDDIVKAAAQRRPDQISSKTSTDEITELIGQLPRKRLKKRKKMEQSASAVDSFVNVFVELDGPAAEQSDYDYAVRCVHKCERKAHALHSSIAPVLVKEQLMLATVPIADLEHIAGLPGVSYVYPADRLVFDAPQVPLADQPSRPRAKRFALESKHQRGKGILIGIIDVAGFDFAHADFQNENGTRFVKIWDQGGRFRSPPAAYRYGAEFDKTHLDAAIQFAGQGGFPASEMEPQSQRQTGSHGTHVASIAAGKYGVCPKADIAAVLITVPLPEDQDQARRQAFSDSSRIIHAVDYLLKLAEERDQAISINISLGTNGGAHDSTSPVSHWLDSELYKPRRAICVATGNAGQEGPRHNRDIGWAMGRIHSSGAIPSQGLSVDLRWTVVGGQIADMSENELELWYQPQDRIKVMLQPPGSKDWIEVKPQQFIKNRRLPNGTTLSIYNELFHPSNGHNYIAIYLSPNLELDAWRPVAPGVWKVRLVGEQIRDGRFHAWIERDDPVVIDNEDPPRLWRFPSFFAGDSNVDSHSINTLACGFNVIAVANLDDGQQRINITSSQGPTRDERLKPEICAPGTNIYAASGFDDKNKWTAKTGTSMASPYVAGVVGLMMAVNSSLTCAQCIAILQSTAKPLPGHTYTWRNDAGFGQIDADAAIKAASSFKTRKELS